MDFIDLPSIFRDKSVQSSIPNYIKNYEVPIICYKYNKPIGHFQLNPIPLPILIMNKIVCFVGSFSKLYSQSVFSAYTSCIYCYYLRFRGPGCPDERFNRKKFQFRSCIFHGQSVIDGFRKGDPNRIPDPYSRSTEEGREV